MLKRPSAMTRLTTSPVDKAYTRLVAHRLGACGRGVQFVFPATIKNPKAIEVGDGVVIREHAWLNCERRTEPTLSIGTGTYIGRFAHINASESVIIEDEVLIADRVHISDYQHAFGDVTRSIVSQGLTEPEPVHIGWGSWLGEGSVVMPGIRIGRGAIVGANAVVTRDVAEFEIVAGVPATVIRVRGAPE
jgi:acetyltransferase-like isoleucine patch superfamily enzyme